MAEDFRGAGKDLEPADWRISIRQTSDGGYIVLGSTFSFGAGREDIMILKLDIYGNLVWQKTYGGTREDFGHFIQQTSDGGYIIAGTTHSFGEGYADFWLLKINEFGVIQWQKRYGGPGYDRATFIQQTSDGGYVVTGYTYSFGAGEADIWILKINENGNIIWQKAYGGNNDDVGASVQQTPDGGYIVSGHSNSFGTGNTDGWLMKLDTSGNIQWQRTYGGLGYDYTDSIQQTSDGGYIVAGHTNSFGAGDSDLWILKIDSEGNIDDPSCTIVKASNGIVKDSFAVAINTSAIVNDANVTIFNTNVIPVDSNLVINNQCWSGPFVDTGSDGLPDDWENQYFGNLNQGPNDDPDEDGLTNLQEYQHGTDPTNPDTDGDGAEDSAELAEGKNPLDNGDIENDDSDSDGLPDLWEKYGFRYYKDGLNIFIDLPKEGAKVGQKDLFLWIDHMYKEGINPFFAGVSGAFMINATDCQPSKELIDAVKEAFKKKRH